MILALVLNAERALAGQEQGPRQLSISCDGDDDHVWLRVTDNGAGLPAMAGAGVSQHGSSLALADAGPVLAERAVLPAVNIGGSGHGIIGMRERVSLLGGEFSAGPLPGYGFQVSAHIPLPPDGVR